MQSRRIMRVFPPELASNTGFTVIDLAPSCPNNCLQEAAIPGEGINHPRHHPEIAKVGFMFALASLWPFGRTKRPWEDHYPRGVPLHIEYPREPLGYSMCNGTPRG